MADPSAASDLPRATGGRLAELELGMFTSDLSVNEFLLIKEIDFHPVGLVMGSSICQIGASTGTFNDSLELGGLTTTMYKARELAMTRMEEEAIVLGADGVVGVRLDVKYYELGGEVAEFLAVGTAVKATNGKNYHNSLGKPFTSDLSGQDFWILMHAGSIPVGLVMGLCVYRVARRTQGQVASTALRNVELTELTTSLTKAKELAMSRMYDEARHLGASGIVGVRFEERKRQPGSSNVEFWALGTAVIDTGEAVSLPDPTTIISLSD